MNRTWFLDIDGTLLKHQGTMYKIGFNEPELIEGTIDKLNEWSKNGDFIVLTTARPSSMRDRTVEDLRKLGIFYNRLLMDLPAGPRCVVNDQKPDLDLVMAQAFPLKRDEGIKNIEVQEKRKIGF